MLEKAKRLAPIPETLRVLYLRSGNLCAFPGCNRLMIDPDGNFVGQICHIEAALEDGERFNPMMSNEDRRREGNLMLMCYDHHVITNNVALFFVEKLKEIKHYHEQRFSDPSHIMLQSIMDTTLAVHPTQVRNLGRLFRSLNWNLKTKEREEMLADVNSYISDFSRIPLETRHFLGQFALRMQRVASTHGLWKDVGREFIPVNDLEETFGLQVEKVRSLFSQLQTYRLGKIERVDCEGVHPPYGAFLFPLPSDWDFWRDVAKFCLKENVDINSITNYLNFSLLDL
jgi:hypothetical protein